MPQSTASSEIHLIHLTKHFRTGRHDRLRALDDVSLWIRRGETMSVVGPTGCGKSTLLRIIAGLEHPESGTVTFDGESVDGLTPGQRNLGLVFQNYALYPHFKVRGNIAFYFRLRRWSEVAVDAKVRETARVMGMGFDKLLGRMPRSLSGGEKQRVALARCLSHNPRVLLLDEPFSNLDAALRLQTRTEVKKLVERFELTTVFVTHDQNEAVSMGHRLAVMQHGRMEQIGSYDELYHKPLNTFVAGFLGSPPMNFFPASRENDRIVLRANGNSVALPIPAYLHNRLPSDETLTIGIRPEHLHLSGPTDSGGLAGSVEMAEMSMSDANQLLHVGCGELIVRVKTALHRTVRPRETVWLQLQPEHLHYFDAGGNRI